MKKALLLVNVLLISVMTTACINNFAVQELNNKAKTYMDAGDYGNAIERLKSSLDLDPTLVETHYNLAVAYTKEEDYDNAIKEYNEVIKLKSDFNDAYYSLAVCEENFATDIMNRVLTVDETGEIKTLSEENDETDSPDKSKMTETEVEYVVKLLENACEHYKYYATLTDDTSLKSESEEKAEELLKRKENILAQGEE